MKVLWIADFGLQHNIGGAQRTDSFIIKEGMNRGHEIQFFNYNTDSNLLKQEFDLVVSGNLENLSRRQDVFDYITNHNNHVRYEHDSNAYLSKTARECLFSSTKHTFFLSEYHHQMFIKLYGDIFNNVEIVTSPISDKFYDYNDPREDKILSVGFLHYLKGAQNLFRRILTNPDQTFVLAAWGEAHLEKTAKSFKNVEWLGKVDYKDMPALFNNYKIFYYHPAKFEPFCRSVGEAILCGMELDCSTNIGAVDVLNNYGKDGIRRLCDESPAKFWDSLLCQSAA